MAPSARTSSVDLVAAIIDASCNIVFLLIQLEPGPHPFALEIPDVELEVANRAKNIRIHLALSRVRFYLLRFNSSGNFCDGDAICFRNSLGRAK
jgi:hypothetical protein